MMPILSTSFSDSPALLAVPGEIEIDNEDSPHFTKLSIEVLKDLVLFASTEPFALCHMLDAVLPMCQVKDYPGLLRVIAWVINGLDLLVENAK